MLKRTIGQSVKYVTIGLFQVNGPESHQWGDFWIWMTDVMNLDVIPKLGSLPIRKVWLCSDMILMFSPVQSFFVDSLQHKTNISEIPIWVLWDKV